MSRHLPAPEYGQKRKSFKTTTVSSISDCNIYVFSGNKSVVINNPPGGSQNAAIAMGGGSYSYQPPQATYGQQQITHPLAAIAPASDYPTATSVDGQMVLTRQYLPPAPLIVPAPPPSPMFYPQMDPPYVTYHHQHRPERGRSHGRHHPHRSPDSVVKYCQCDRSHDHRYHLNSATHHSSPPSGHTAGFQVASHQLVSANATCAHGYAAYQPAPSALEIVPAPVAYQPPRIEQILITPVIVHHQNSPVLQPTTQPVVQQASTGVSHHSAGSNNGWNLPPTPTKEASVHVHQSSPAQNSNSGGGWGSTPSSPPAYFQVQQPARFAVPPSPRAEWRTGPSDSPEQATYPPAYSRLNNAPAAPAVTKSGHKKKPAWNAGGPGKPKPAPRRKYWGEDSNPE